jgi:hypothetical protein
VLVFGRPRSAMKVPLLPIVLGGKPQFFARFADFAILNQLIHF